MSMKPNIIPRWLTLEGAARYCGVSSRTIENYIKDGLIVSANVIRIRMLRDSTASESGDTALKS